MNVALIVVDTLGARHLGCYTPGLSNSPEIDLLAKSGAKFENSFATSSWTKPSLASIFTSLMPIRHKSIGPALKLPIPVETVAELLQRRGYSTLGVVSHTLLGPRSGFQQGFDEYRQMNTKKKVHSSITSNLVSDEGIRLLKKHLQKGDRKPFFLFLHYFDPHFNYRDHEDYEFTKGYEGRLRSGMSLNALERAKKSMTAEDINYLKALYHEEIAYTDAQIGRMVDFLDASGLRENTLIIVTADHGEGFLEHGMLGHTSSLYDELVRVPLILNLPGRIAPSTFKSPVTGLDLLPTVADYLDIKPAQTWEGISLKSSLEKQEEPKRESPVFMEVSYVTQKRIISPDIVALVDDQRKIIFDLQRKRWHVYDTVLDPFDSTNLAEGSRGDIITYREKLQPLIDLHRGLKDELFEEPQNEIEMQKDEIKQLKTLGYL
ncbi:MAG: sulfatase [Deltaproteobacteria bacterium]|nr:sulfatase [Deltaproteobacteria bacterium]